MTTSRPRFNKHGIRILDPQHEDNKLPRLCRWPRAHEWRQVETTQVGYDAAYDISYEKVHYVCALCGMRDTRDRIDE
jgi:hypothetical protein